MEERRIIDAVERAVDQGTVLNIRYRDLESRESQRDIRPLGLWFWGKVWTVIGWCELRNAFRTFRTDRIVEASDAGRLFRAERGKTLADFYRLMEMSEYNAFQGLALQLQIRQAVAKRVIFEYRSGAYLRVREHRNADKLLFAVRHHEECNCSVRAFPAKVRNAYAGNQSTGLISDPLFDT